MREAVNVADAPSSSASRVGGTDRGVEIERALRNATKRLLEGRLASFDRAEDSASCGLQALNDEQLGRRLATEIVASAASVCAEQRGLGSIGGRLAEALHPLLSPDLAVELRQPFWAVELSGGSRVAPFLELPLEALGGVYEWLAALAAREARRSGTAEGSLRKKSGSFFTPPELTRAVLRTALAPLFERVTSEQALLDLRICDPALGAGAFLLEACRQLGERLVELRGVVGRPEALVAARRDVALRCLYGVDRAPLAVATAEISLWLLVGDCALRPEALGRNLACADSLLDFDWSRFAHGERATFDAVVGNPPWVAFAGRAAQPLAIELRRAYKRRFSAWRGYPTLHGLFVERSSELAPNGIVALLVPSPIADLDGYRATRRALRARHIVREPLLELGQDAFDAVTQPCIALIADPRSETADASEPRELERPFKLVERQRLACEAAEVRVPELVEFLVRAPALPAELFGELGFQSSSLVTERLFRRSTEPDDIYSYPLLEGRDVAEFREGAPRLFLHPEAETLRRAGCRLRPAHDYHRARFVVRQTAAVPIAALHAGLPFRNTLLAGFDHAVHGPALMVGLLNSALYRALHVAARRDARQAAFPQVKIRHLRALPRPPRDPSTEQRIVDLALRATADGLTAPLRDALDTAVFDLFGVPNDHRAELVAFLGDRAPKLGHVALGAVTTPRSSLDAVRKRLFDGRADVDGESPQDQQSLFEGRWSRGGSNP